MSLLLLFKCSDSDSGYTTPPCTSLWSGLTLNDCDGNLIVSKKNNTLNQYVYAISSNAHERPPVVSGTHVPKEKHYSLPAGIKYANENVFNE